jgi:DNA replication protein DnaC
MSAANPVARKNAPKVDLDATRDKLTRLGLAHASEHVGETLAEAAKESWPAHRFLDRLLEAELSVREERRMKTSLRLSGLPTGQTLGNFDFAFQPGVERSRIETLATCAWIRSPGVGKTHLAIGLAIRAIENGFSVAFHRLEDLLAALKRDAEVSPQRLRRRKHMNVALLVIDEMGFEVMTREEASLFFRLVSYRYGRGAIAITTNKGIADWPEMLAGDEVLATAILDRLLHRSHVLNISGRSYRLRELESVATKTRAGS